MRAAVIQFPGSNCDRDMAVAIRDITGNDDTLWCWHQHGRLHKNFEPSGKKQEFGLRAHLGVAAAVDQEVSDLFADLGPARCTAQHRGGWQLARDRPCRP